jgi:hypothetical protein
MIPVSGGFMSIKVMIHSTGTGTCSLTGKEDQDGLTVTFEDGTVKDAFLSFKSFKQLLSLKTAQSRPAPKAPVAQAVPSGN